VTDHLQTELVALRGGLPYSAIDARRVAGSLEQPGCPRRQLIDAAAIPIDNIARVLDCPEPGQSPFAITRGNAFENAVFDNGMAELLAIVRDKLGYELAHTQVDLSAEALQQRFGRVTNALRVRETRLALRAMIDGEPEAPCIIRHPLTTLQVA
jgi:hypothetical protein